MGQFLTDYWLVQSQGNEMARSKVSRQDMNLRLINADVECVFLSYSFTIFYFFFKIIECSSCWEDQGWTGFIIRKGNFRPSGNALIQNFIPLESPTENEELIYLKTEWGCQKPNQDFYASCEKNTILPSELVLRKEHFFSNKRGVKGCLCTSALIFTTLFGPF